MRTLDICGAIFCNVDLEKVVTGYDISTGDVIIGLRSGGELEYESKLNSGIMCNGFTLARNCLLSKKYLKNHPEIAHPKRGRYNGRFKINDEPEGLEMSIGEALTSPTRIFAPIAAEVLDKVGESVHGMIHNTGGGQTKCLGLGKRIKYVKDSLIKPDPIFILIQQEGNIEWKEMYEDFNMGVGFELIVEPGSEDNVMDVVEKFNIDAQVIGSCKKGAEENSLVINSKHGKFLYNNKGLKQE
jgi:phosphoribosylformylglycinamidine cyclo-ligase